MADITTENPYGLVAALEQGGIVAQAIFGAMVLMSAISWFIMFNKYFEQRKMLSDSIDTEKKVWNAGSLKDGVAKLDKNSGFRQLAEDGIRAFDHHAARGTEQVDQHEWVSMALNRSSSLISSKLNKGLSFLASVGATAPFIGLLGTVIGIYRALVSIGVSGSASIDKVAGPVGEALIMTAIGLAVAVPAVLGYNWLAGRNKVILERLNMFAADIHGHLMSGARIERAKAAAPAAAKPAAK